MSNSLAHFIVLRCSLLYCHLASAGPLGVCPGCPHATFFFLTCLSEIDESCLEQPIQNIHHDLIERCRVGDRAAFYRIYKLYSKAMFNTAFRIVGWEEEAEDVLQESFTSAFRNLESYRGDASFGAWLKKIVVNKAINALKRRKMEPLPEDERWDVAAAEPEAPYREEEGLTVEKVKHSIEQLPDGYRSVLSLYLMEGYDHQEIAEILGITESTSKSQLNRAKNKLKEILIKKI